MRILGAFLLAVGMVYGVAIGLGTLLTGGELGPMEQMVAVDGAVCGVLGGLLLLADRVNRRQAATPVS